MHRIHICVALVLAGVTVSGLAQGPSDWLAAREREFAAWQTANPDVQERLSTLKARTAALVSAHVPARMGAKYSDLRQRSASLSPGRRQEARAHFDSATRWLDLGDQTSAKEFLDLGLAIDPANVTAISLRAFIYLRDAERTSDQHLRRGYRVNAALYLDRVRTLAPDTPEARKAADALRALPAVTEEAETTRAPVIWRVPDAPREVWDAPYAPKLTVIPAGEYTMGAALAEGEMEMYRTNTSLPRHRVRIAYPLAVGTYPITRGEFAAFATDTGFDGRSMQCNFLGLGPGATWDNPGFVQTDNDPMVCASYDVAMTYVAWLSRKTGRTYRLLSEAEWEYAARAGTTTTYHWGNDVAAGHANCPDCGSQWDRRRPSPVGSFPPNGFGLFDMAGNVWEVVGDCWNYSYAGAPSDGSAWRAGNCANSLERGGSFNQSASAASASYRGGRADPKERGLNIHGFRVARVF